MKACQKCNVNKPLSEYNKDRTRPDGYKYVCRDCQRGQGTTYSALHRNQIRAKSARWYANNRGRRKIVARQWRTNNIGKWRAYLNEWCRANPTRKLTHNIRNVIRQALRRQGVNKRHSTIESIGCSADELKYHIERQFQPGMSWGNWGNGHGKWNIDHIRPLASFDLSDESQFAAACHYTNLQPLWWIDNMRKGARQS